MGSLWYRGGIIINSPTQNITPAKSSAGIQPNRAMRFLRGGLQFAVYGAIGISCAGLDFFAFFVLSHLFPPLVANTASVGLGIGASYALNSRITFRDEERGRTTFLRFVSVGLTGLAISNAIIFFLIHIAGYGELGAKALTIPVIARLQFMLNKLWTFRKRPSRYAVHPSHKLGETRRRSSRVRPEGFEPPTF
jgi:putative flippase GtrA